MKDLAQSPRVNHLSKASDSQLTHSTNMGGEDGVISAMDQVPF